ncbi:hypothetical protein BDZ97DRAFT_1767410 [Flammula alnicola]|nr:hypothetical protein BDZ97DRAFT_1767410 [Flammula alnicola]
MTEHLLRAVSSPSLSPLFQTSSTSTALPNEFGISSSRLFHATSIEALWKSWSFPDVSESRCGKLTKDSQIYKRGYIVIFLAHTFSCAARSKKSGDNPNMICVHLKKIMVPSPREKMFSAARRIGGQMDGRTVFHGGPDRVRSSSHIWAGHPPAYGVSSRCTWCRLSKGVGGYGMPWAQKGDCRDAFSRQSRVKYGIWREIRRNESTRLFGVGKGCDKGLCRKGMSREMFKSTVERATHGLFGITWEIGLARSFYERAIHLLHNAQENIDVNTRQ